MPKTRDGTDKPKTRDRNIPGFRLRKSGTTSLTKSRDGTKIDETEPKHFLKCKVGSKKKFFNFDCLNDKINV